MIATRVNPGPLNGTGPIGKGQLGISVHTLHGDEELWPHSSPLSGESLRERPSLDVRALTAPILVRRYPLPADSNTIVPPSRPGTQPRRIIVCINAIRKSPLVRRFAITSSHVQGLRKCVYDTRARHIFYTDFYETTCHREGLSSYERPFPSIPRSRSTGYYVIFYK